MCKYVHVCVVMIVYGEHILKRGKKKNKKAKNQKASEEEN